MWPRCAPKPQVLFHLHELVALLDQLDPLLHEPLFCRLVVGGFLVLYTTRACRIVAGRNQCECTSTSRLGAGVGGARTRLVEHAAQAAVHRGAHAQQIALFLAAAAAVAGTTV